MQGLSIYHCLELIKLELQSNQLTSLYFTEQLGVSSNSFHLTESIQEFDKDFLRTTLCSPPTLGFFK